MNPNVKRHPSDEEINQALVKRPDLDPILTRAQRREHSRGGKHSRYERSIQERMATGGDRENGVRHE